MSARLTPQQVTQVSDFVAQYITAQRERFTPQATLLVAAQKAAMDGFFLPRVLNSVRVLVLNGIRVENPPFYPMLAAVGFSNLPDFYLMAAITFRNVVVSHVPLTDGLLFHELVHVEQFHQLGIPRFSELYVRRFLSGGYDGITLEVNTYALGRHFEAHPRRQFSVADHVARATKECRLLPEMRPREKRDTRGPGLGL